MHAPTDWRVLEATWAVAGNLCELFPMQLGTLAERLPSLAVSALKHCPPLVRDQAAHALSQVRRSRSSFVISTVVAFCMKSLSTFLGS